MRWSAYVMAYHRSRIRCCPSSGRLVCLDVEFVILGWTEVQEALAAGEVDVAINNISSVIATYDAFRSVYGFNIFDAGAALMARPEFKSVEEFEEEGMERADAVVAALQQMQGGTVVTTGNTDMGRGCWFGGARRPGGHGHHHC